jgi:hypothetical protein
VASRPAQETRKIIKRPATQAIRVGKGMIEPGDIAPTACGKDFEERIRFSRRVAKDNPIEMDSNG